MSMQNHAPYLHYFFFVFVAVIVSSFFLMIKNECLTSYVFIIIIFNSFGEIFVSPVPLKKINSYEDLFWHRRYVLFKYSSRLLPFSKRYLHIILNFWWQCLKLINCIGEHHSLTTLSSSFSAPKGFCSQIDSVILQTVNPFQLNKFF